MGDQIKNTYAWALDMAVARQKETSPMMKGKLYNRKGKKNV